MTNAAAASPPDSTSIWEDFADIFVEPVAVFNRRRDGKFGLVLLILLVPAAAEETMVARDVILAQMTGSHLHVAHLSTAGAVEAVRNARRAGVLGANGGLYAVLLASSSAAPVTSPGPKVFKYET